MLVSVSLTELECQGLSTCRNELTRASTAPKGLQKIVVKRCQLKGADTSMTCTANGLHTCNCHTCSRAYREFSILRDAICKARTPSLEAQQWHRIRHAFH